MCVKLDKLLTVNNLAVASVCIALAKLVPLILTSVSEK